MNQTLKKLLDAMVLLLVIFTTVAGQGSSVAYAAKPAQGSLETPLAPGFTWKDLGQTTRSITLNIKGDTISLSGDTYRATERFGAQLPQEMVSFYSNEQLFNTADWTSDNSFETTEGLHQIFYHESGVYLAVDFVSCADETSATCVTVWKSEQASNATVIAGPDLPAVSIEPNAPGTFSKTSPANGNTLSISTTIKLSWGVFVPTPDKYSYCVKAGSQCADNDPNWTGTYLNTSVNVPGLLGGKKYYWQVKAITCSSCIPKKLVYANSGIWWTFTTTSNIISGNVGVAGATLSYVDSGTKTVISDSAGNYLINPPYNWTGTVTPSKTGYTFSPVSRPYSNIKVPQTNQNYLATVITRTITGNAGAAGVTLSYTDGIAKTVISDGTGAYTITLPYGWSGTVTPTKTCLNFVPSSMVYSSVVANQANQNYSVNPVSPIISGNAGVGLATLSYSGSTSGSVQALANGNYLIPISCAWTGTVTPSLAGFSFRPASLSYSNVMSGRVSQNFVALVTISGNAGAGTTITYMDGIYKTVTADGSGNYSLIVPYHWSGTLTPGRLSTIFSPTSISLVDVTSSLSGQNFVPAAGVSISGNVGIGGVALSFTDGSAQVAYSAPDGSYIVGVSSTWAGTVTPSRNGLTFNPANMVYASLTVNQTAQDYQIVWGGASTAGVFRPSNGSFYLRNTNTTGTADIAINYGLPGDHPIVGDWDGNGTDTIGVYRNGSFYLRNLNTTGFADLIFAFGSAGDRPVAGDWNGDGFDTIGVYRSSTATFYLRNTNSTGPADVILNLGRPGDVGLAGDWTAKGYDTVGVFRPANGALYLKNLNTSGIADIAINYGLPGDKPVTGDWNNDGTDTIGIFRGGMFYLRNTNTTGFADLKFGLGMPGDLPIAGNWDGLP